MSAKSRSFASAYGLPLKRVLLSCAAVAAIALPARAQQPVQDLPVTRVILSTSGLAHFEHEGSVIGDASVELPVRLDQVDDMLKSLVVRDNTGLIGGVTLPGRAPLDEIFRDLPFSRDALNSPVALLNALQGAEVEISGPSSARGRLLRVVPEVARDDDVALTRHRVSLMTADGLETLILENLDEVSFVDPEIEQQIADALAALLEHRAADRRTLEISLLGDGERPVGLGYVVAAPLWKSAYRVVVPREGEQGLFQGWAILENRTGTDWNDVELTLVSGNPVTFRQELYLAYYAERPRLPVEVLGRVMPRTDSGTVATAGQMEMAMAEAEELDVAGNRLRGGFALGRAAGAMPAPSPAAPAMDMAQAMRAETTAAPRAQALGMANAATAAESDDATTQVLFRFPNDISLDSGETMMVPFVSQILPIERLWLYQPETHPRHPLSSIEVTNEGGSGLPPGILTLYEDAGDGVSTYVGDAQLPVLARGESRQVSFALDAKTQIDRAPASRQDLRVVTISKGVLRSTYQSRSETAYTIKAPAEEDRLIVIEHPRQGGWNLTQPEPGEVDVTATHYRVRVEVPAGESVTQRVILERPNVQTVALANLGVDQLAAYASQSRRIEPDVARALERMAEMRRDIDTAEQAIRRLDEQRQRMFQDQDRIRNNLRSVPFDSDLGQRYRRNLRVQEDRLDALNAEREGQEQALNAARQKLESFIAELDI